MLTRMCWFNRRKKAWLGSSCVSSSYLDKLAQVDVIRYKELGFVPDRQLPLTLVWLYYPQDLSGVLLSDELVIFPSLLESSTLLEGFLQPQGTRVRLGGPASCNRHFCFFKYFACMFEYRTHAVSAETRRGLQIPSASSYRQLRAVLAVLMTEPRLCKRTGSALFHGAIFPSHMVLFLLSVDLWQEQLKIYLFSRSQFNFFK